MNSRYIRTSITTLLISLAISSCKDEHNSSATIFKELDSTLYTDNKIIKNYNEAILSTIKDNLTQPASRAKAEIWYPKAVYIHKYSTDLTNYIEALKTSLKHAAIIKHEGSNPLHNEDTEGVKRILLKNQTVTQLFEKLKNFEKDIAKVDSNLAKDVGDRLNLLSSKITSSTDLFNEYFVEISAIGAITTLSQFQNKIVTKNNMLLNWCRMSSSTVICSFPSTSVIIGQNKSQLIIGEELEITAGIGSFSRAAMPKITINGKLIPLNEEGYVFHKLPTPNELGRHKIPAIIEFIDEEGKKQTISKMIEYTLISKKAR